MDCGDVVMLLPEYQLPISFVNSNVNRQKGGGRTGQHPYMESVCCRLQQTTRVKKGAHGAQSCQLIELNSLGVGSVEIHTVPIGCPCIKMGLDSSWTPVNRGVANRGTVSV